MGESAVIPAAEGILLMLLLLLLQQQVTVLLVMVSMMLLVIQALLHCVEIIAPSPYVKS